MADLLKEILNFIVGVGISIVELLGLCLSFLFDSFIILHTQMPRLEGVLIGVLLAWLMARRDKHPILKVLSAPLKMVLDVLDLLWDEVCEFTADSWGLVKSWVRKPYDWAKSVSKKGYDIVVNGLSLLKVKFSKKKEE